MAPRIPRGMLVRMLDMSLDIWLEVVSYLDPLDLLHLARRSADLYSIFTSPTSKILWKAARKTVDFPAPVTGLSELALADLLYVNKCHFCRVATVHKVKFSFLTRICNACYKEHVISHPATDPLTVLMASLVPSVLKGRTTEYLRKDFEAVKAEYFSLPNNKKDAYYKKRRAYLKEVDNFYLAGTAWDKHRKKARSAELKEKKKKKILFMETVPTDRGYYDVLRSKDLRSVFHKPPSAKKPSDLDERGWDFIRDTDIEVAEKAMQELADTRAAGDLVDDNRITIVTALLEGPDPSRIIKVPSIFDFLNVPHHKTLIEAPVSTILTEKEFKPLVDAFRNEWMDRTLDELIQILGEIQLVELTKYQKRAYLELARNAFECRRCLARGLVFPQVLEHECCIYSLPELERKCIWTARSLSRQDTAFMSTFIWAVNLDAEIATLDDIDSLSRHYRCLLCPEAYHLDGKPKNVYKCRPFIEHMDGHISGGTSVVYYPQDFEIMPLERMEDDPATNNAPNDVAPRGCRLPGCHDPNCLLIYMQD